MSENTSWIDKVISLFGKKDEECTHVWGSSLITGFRHDGYAIGRCQVCDMPIVNKTIRCTKYVVDDLRKGQQ